MSNANNALAELAERLDRVGVELCRDELDADSKDAVHKAKCIIAELAKVEDVIESHNLKLVQVPNSWQCYDAVAEAPRDRGEMKADCRDEMSKQKRYRYTAQEMREMAGHLIADICDVESECNEYRNAIGSFDLLDCEWALRQAADDAEENAQIKARLDAVVKECANQRQKIAEVKDIDAPLAYDLGLQVDAILRAARGEREGAE